MLVFLVFNDVIFSILNIELDSFKVAGGIILFILGLQIVLGLEIGGKAAHEARAEQARDGAELLPGKRREERNKKLLTNGRRYDRVSELPLRPGETGGVSSEGP